MNIVNEHIRKIHTIFSTGIAFPIIHAKGRITVQRTKQNTYFHMICFGAWPCMPSLFEYQSADANWSLYEHTTRNFQCSSHHLLENIKFT